MKTDSNQMKTDSNQMKTDSNQMKTDSNQMKTDSNQMKTDSNQMKTDSNQMKTDSNQMKTDSNQMKTDSNQMKTDSNQMKTDSNQMKTDSNQMKTLYDDNGYLTSVDVLQEEQLLHALQEYAKLEEKFGKEYTQYSLHNVHLEYEWVMNLTTHPNLLEAITAVLGPNVILLDSRFICKYPASDVPHKENTAPYVAWHQDIKYWGFEGGPVASVWLAFDDVDAENGVLQIIPGSHKQGILEHRVAEVPGNMLTANQEIPKHLVNVEDLVECPLKAGQMSVHDGLTVHASEPNMSERRRCGFVIRYVPTTAYPIKDPERPRTFPATVLVAGTNEYNHFKDHAPNFFTKTL